MDIKVSETGNGGDISLKGNDLELVLGYENMPYLGTFGGEENWWGNVFLESGNDFKFSAKTEAFLNSIALNSANRVKAEQSILSDLAFIKRYVPGTDIKVTVIIVSDDRIDIKVDINGQLFLLNWGIDPEITVSTVTEVTPLPDLSPYVWYKAEDMFEGLGLVSYWLETVSNYTLYALKNTEGPLLVAYIGNQLNGYPAAELDGNDKNIFSHERIDLTHTDKITVFVVMAQSSPGGVIISFTEPQSDIGAGNDFTTLNDSWGVTCIGGTSMTAIIPDGLGGGPFLDWQDLETPGDWQIYEFMFDRATGPGVLMNNVPPSLTASGGSPGGGNFGLHYLMLGGLGSGLKEQIAEIIIYDKQITTDERNQTVAYLQNKFGL